MTLRDLWRQRGNQGQYAQPVFDERPPNIPAGDGSDDLQARWKALLQAAQGGQTASTQPTGLQQAPPQRPSTRPPVRQQAPPTKPGGGMFQGGGQQPPQQSQGNTFSGQQIQDAVKNFTPYGGGGFAGKAGRTSQSQTQAPTQQPDVSAWGSHLYG